MLFRSHREEGGADDVRELNVDAPGGGARGRGLTTDVARGGLRCIARGRFWGEASARQRGGEGTGRVAASFCQMRKSLRRGDARTCPGAFASFAHGHGPEIHDASSLRCSSSHARHRASRVSLMLRLGRFRHWATREIRDSSRGISQRPDPAPRLEGSTLAPLSSRADGPARTLTRRGDAAVAVPRNVAPSTATRDTLSACSNAMYRGFFRASSRDTHSAPYRAPSRVHASGLGEN